MSVVIDTATAAQFDKEAYDAEFDAATFDIEFDADDENEGGAAQLSCLFSVFCLTSTCGSTA